MKRIRTFLLVLSCAAPALAAAQWAWVDASGRKVFSDQPPPPSVPDRSILRSPAPRTPTITLNSDGAATPNRATPAAPAAAAAASPQRPTSSARDAAEADEERVARMKADNCNRARGAKATVESGVRLVRTNEKGEREFLDDNARASELQRLNEIIASDCAAP